MASALYTTAALLCRCQSPLAMDGEGREFCTRSLRPVGLCVPLEVVEGTSSPPPLPVELLCRCGRTLNRPGKYPHVFEAVCIGCLVPPGLCTCPPAQASAIAPDPDDPVGARRQEAPEELEEEPGAELPFHPEPECPRCMDTGLVREGPSRDAFCTCPAGEARAWEVRHG